ncbi:TetR/AcrR family transcriptional regulator [Parasphingorhabdus pacifica]
MTTSTAAERGREVRQRLLKAAAELIPERGWQGVSTRNLAERADVAPGLVHYHFASLQALLGEAAISEMRGMVTGIGAVLEEANTPEAVLEVMLGALDEYSGRDPASLLFIETFLAATRDDDLRRAVGSVLHDVRGMLVPVLRDHGVAEPEATAAVLASALDGVMLHRALDPDMTAGTVAPVLRRVLGSANSADDTVGTTGGEL